jgi:hypothetical protein
MPRTTATDPLPAIRRIETDRGDLCALEIVGHFTANDLENAYGLLEAAYTEHEKVDLLVRMGRYDGFDWSAIVNRRTIGGKTQALRHIRKYAVVGGPAWISPMLVCCKPLTSIKLKHFAVGDETKAWEWIGGKELKLDT